MDNTERVAQSRPEHDGSAPPFQTDDIQLLRYDQLAELVFVLGGHPNTTAQLSNFTDPELLRVFFSIIERPLGTTDALCDVYDSFVSQQVFDVLSQIIFRVFVGAKIDSRHLSIPLSFSLKSRKLHF